MKLTKWASLVITLAGVAAARPSMTIRILDQANLPAGKIQKMERYVEQTLASIDVDVNWVDCATNLAACKARRGPNEFWLRVLAQMPPAENGIDLLGFTQHGDAADGIQCVNIFYPMVEQLSSRERTDAHQVFGAAVAHEIGHLYLGTNRQAHSPSGVMCGTWSHRQFELASLGELTFTREQGARIRAAMSAASGSKRWIVDTLGCWQARCTVSGPRERPVLNHVVFGSCRSPEPVIGIGSPSRSFMFEVSGIESAKGSEARSRTSEQTGVTGASL